MLVELGFLALGTAVAGLGAAHLRLYGRVRQLVSSLENVQSAVDGVSDTLSVMLAPRAPKPVPTPAPSGPPKLAPTRGATFTRARRPPRPRY